MRKYVRLGVGYEDITPHEPVMLAGFGFRKTPMEGIHSPLGLRCFLFGGRRTVAVFSADSLEWGKDVALYAEHNLKKEFPASRNWKCLFLATHTHYAPLLTTTLSPNFGLGKFDAGYVRGVIDSVVSVAKSAAANREKVSAVLYRGKTSIPINRRKLVDGKWEMAPNPEGPKNDGISLVEFLTSTGKVKAVMAAATCHPTTSGDNLVDREFLAKGLDGYLKNRGYENAVGMFVQGCCGDTRPAVVKDGKFYRGKLAEESDRFAAKFRDELLAARSREGTSVDFYDEPDARKKTASLPLQRRFPHSEKWKYIFESSEIGEWARRWVLWQIDEMPMDFYAFDLAKQLSFVFFSSETVGYYGRYAASISRDEVFAGSYCNGCMTYVPEAKQISEGGYEPYEAMFWDLIPAPFAPGLQKKIEEIIAFFVRTRPHR